MRFRHEMVLTFEEIRERTMLKHEINQYGIIG